MIITVSIHEDAKRSFSRQAVSSCMLDTSVFTVIGVGTGLVAFFRTRKKRHFVIAAAAGTVADMVYGYYGSCRPLRNDYDKCKASYDENFPQEKAPSPFDDFSVPKFANLDDYTTEKPKGK